MNLCFSFKIFFVLCWFTIKSVLNTIATIAVLILLWIPNNWSLIFIKEHVISFTRTFAIPAQFWKDYYNSLTFCNFTFFSTNFLMITTSCVFFHFLFISFKINVSIRSLFCFIIDLLNIDKKKCNFF